jgi:ribosomal protein S18 acetylase RimI-like enzyme
MWRRCCDARDPDSRLLVAEDGEGLSAFAARRRLPTSEPIGTEGEATAIHVLRRSQRRGLGRELVPRLFAFMAGRGMASARLWGLRENWGAHAFYRRLGGVEGPSGRRRRTAIATWRWPASGIL